MCMKNIEKAKVLQLAEQVAYQDGQIVSRTLAQNSAVSLTLFAVERGEEISTHAAGGDAMVSPCSTAPAGSPSAIRRISCTQAKRS